MFLRLLSRRNISTKGVFVKVEKSRTPRYLPILGGFSLLALGYVSYPKIIDSRQSELSPTTFTSYRISYKKNIDDDHFLIELTPKIKQNINIWVQLGSNKLWSVEVKQPEIMVVRRYTPLPLEYKNDSDSISLFNNGNNAHGKLFFYVKQYSQGEVARWLHNKEEGDVVELRGPFIEYELPSYEDEVKQSRGNMYSEFTVPGDKSEDLENYKYQPYDISMYTAGTGIVPALQLLLTDPAFRGKIQLFYSCQTFEQLGPLRDFLNTSLKNKKIQLNVFESSKGDNIKNNIDVFLKTIKPPTEYIKNLPFDRNHLSEMKPVLSLVCGPDDYITTIAGEKYDLSQGPIGGLLKQKGWTADNVYKLP